MSLHVFRGRDPDDESLRARYAELMNDEAECPGDHPDEEVWVRLACGELDGPERDRVASHVVRCASCATLYRGVSELRREAQGLEPGSRPVVREPASAGGRPALVKLALAAAAVVVLTGAALFVSQLRHRATPPAGVAATSTTPAASPTTQSPPAPAPRAWALALTPPGVVLPAGLAIAMRGADTRSDEFLRAFGAAIGPYREGRYAAAVPLLRDLSTRYPDSREVTFYLAAALLLDGHAQEAAPLLAGDNWPEALHDDARWLHAVAMEQLGNTRAADATLEALCRDDGPRQREACAAAGKPRPPQ